MYFMLLLIVILQVLWGAPEHRLRGAVVRFDDDDDGDDEGWDVSLETNRSIFGATPDHYPDPGILEGIFTIDG